MRNIYIQTRFLVKRNSRIGRFMKNIWPMKWAIQHARVGDDYASYEYFYIGKVRVG